MKPSGSIFGALVCLLLLCAPVAAEEGPAPRVVASIKPLHSLVAGVMQGVAQPELVVSGGGSPHGYSLRPSEARMLAQADLVIWIGPELESFLLKPLQTLGQQARQLQLTRALAGQLLPWREGGQWEDHDHDHAPDRHNHRDSATGQLPPRLEGQDLNPHLWLDPLLAKQVVAQTVAALSDIDPSRRSRYQQNGTALLERLDQLHQQLIDRLAPVRTIPYIVFHDAYHYFEAAYGLRAVGSITINPERRPGARTIAEIRAKIKKTQARCVFSEPQFEPRLVSTIIEGTGARTGILDPLGADIPAGPDHYFLLLKALADNLLLGLR